MMAGLGLALLSAGSAYAATITVTNGSDSDPGSLRQAMLDARPGDTIIFDSSAFSTAVTINLTGGQIEISKSLTIDGAQNAGVVTPTLSGVTSHRIFQIDAGANVVLNRLNITNGDCYQCAGGGVYVAAQGSLTIRNATFTSNNADIAGGALANEGTTDISNSTFNGNYAPYGGALRNSNQLSLDKVIITANTAVYDGGIRNEGIRDGVITQTAVLMLGNSAIYSNSASQYGGGVHNIFPGNAVITNSTFVSNSAAMNGGAIQNDISSTLSIVNATVYANSAGGAGGGVYNEGFITLTNSIIAGSMAGGMAGGNCAWQNRAPYDAGGNLEDAKSCALNDTGLTPSKSGVNPLLGSLRVNAPSAIPTMALLSGSPALNAGSDAACPATDARGVKRVQGAHCDIGAYEAFGHAVFIPFIE